MLIILHFFFPNGICCAQNIDFVLSRVEPEFKLTLSNMCIEPSKRSVNNGVVSNKANFIIPVRFSLDIRENAQSVSLSKH